MIARLAHIHRHPIKSIGGEGLGRVSLRAARRLPGDREWAVLTEAGERNAQASQTGGQPDRWLPKSCFVRGVAAAPVQAIRGGWQGARLSLRHPDRPDLDFDPETESARLIDWLAPLWPAEAAPPTRLVRGAAIWTDQKWPWISILSLSSLVDLEARAGQPLGLDRWRGNLWVEGWAPFAERDLIGRVIRIGAVELRVTAHIGRCEATSASTRTGRRDIDMLKTLEEQYGHTDFGIFAEVVTGGDIETGDEVTA
ncbi:MOSC domain-containing protein [Paracoccus spongiarum]|uniref:MOSC domain-containing protein n=1 Tax=Paracoccus spongiarum TaxID=3064387 RepID=A0ABT9J8I4_9RHOB|nr:MOSC domain-containing protein [Paracoccus sp. 2205BS29-5]MDP5305940.1 MOSC domain-containing protein [Paracoccus sp. 2205BS29-5]